MGLVLKYNHSLPISDIDGYDTEIAGLKGGEVATIRYIALTNSDKAASDANGGDGYSWTPTERFQVRPVITRNLVSGNRPLGLIDDGNSPFYGTMFGSLLGSNVGREAYGVGDTPSTVFGPGSAVGSGKVTLYTAPGTYAVTLNAADTTSATGLTTTNTTLAGGAGLYASSTGLLTPNSGNSFESVIVARFISFETNGSLVTTPINLVSAANSPVGYGGPQQNRFVQALLYWNPPVS